MDEPDRDKQNLMIAIGVLMHCLGLQNTTITYEEAQVLTDKQLGTMADNGRLYIEVVDKKAPNV